jgi:3-hydroxybutyryl-CoA dehydrogenase
MAQKIGVIGAGQMGSGIAQLFATYGHQTVVLDLQVAALDRAKSGIAKSLEKLAAKQVIASDVPSQAMAKLSFASEFSALSACDLVIEAITEQESVKFETLKKLDSLLAPHAVIASNTSSISITKLGANTKRPGQVIGMHFMNPVPIMKLVEIIPGIATDPKITEQITALAKSLAKTTVISKDYPGFIVNRILMPMINEAFRALTEGLATAEDIDAGMKFGTNQPMGPLALADFIGLDTCVAIMDVLHRGLGDDRYAPCSLIKKYVEAGFYGVKAGRGVYVYPPK